jgi:hypothetical protein
MLTPSGSGAASPDLYPRSFRSRPGPSLLRCRQQRDEWRLTAKLSGSFTGIFQQANHLQRWPQREDDILLPDIVAEGAGAPGRGQFRSQSFRKDADQSWFLPENQGNPSMQIHTAKIDMFLIHILLRAETIGFPPANLK